MSTAKEWGLTPDAWYGATRAARAMMIATCAMQARVESAVMNGDK